MWRPLTQIVEKRGNFDMKKQCQDSSPLWSAHPSSEKTKDLETLADSQTDTRPIWDSSVLCQAPCPLVLNKQKGAHHYDVSRNLHFVLVG